MQSTRTVPSHLAWSVVCIVLFWPLAIPAILNASRVRSRQAAGDLAGAEAASGRARTFAILATVIGAVLWLATCGLALFAAAAPTQAAGLVAHLVGRR